MWVIFLENLSPPRVCSIRRSAEAWQDQALDSDSPLHWRKKPTLFVLRSCNKIRSVMKLQAAIQAYQVQG